MKPIAILAESVHPAADPILWEAGFAIERHAGALEGAHLHDAMARATLLGLRSKTSVRQEAWSAGTPAAIGCFCIGTDQVDLVGANHAGIPVFNSPFSNTRSVAEMTVGEAICLARGLFAKSVQLHQGVWDKSAKDAHEVRGRTLGIVGYGHIGSQVSVLAEALGMRVVFHDIVRKLPLGNAQARPTLDALLAESDVVTLHVPSTPATKRLIGAPQIARMKRGAALINNARGSVVDIEALAEALRSGHLSGAALDVFPKEPASRDEAFESALRGLNCVILTPHIGGSTEEAQEAIAVEVAEKLARHWTTGSTASAVNFPEVDLPTLRAGQVRIMHVHRNVPGVLSTMHGHLAREAVNINAEYLQSDPHTSYVILDVEPFEGDGILTALRSLPQTLRMRVVHA